MPSKKQRAVRPVSLREFDKPFPRSTTPVVMAARLQTKCRTCGHLIHPPDMIIWYPSDRRAEHQTCSTPRVEDAASPSPRSPEAAQRQQAIDLWLAGPN